MSQRRFTWMMAAVVAAGCVDAGPADPSQDIALFAEVFLNSALDVMEFNSVRRFEIDWPAFRAEAREDALGAQTPAETYPAIVAALERIGDNHSFFVGAGQLSGTPAMSSVASAADGTSATDAPARAQPMTDEIAPGVGYIDVPAFSGGGPEGDTLAAEYHRLIEAVDTLAQGCRWVVDLRGNTGGNMWPMVAGVGPVLGMDTVGFFVYPDSVETAWVYYEGWAGIETEAIARATDWYELGVPQPHVAVLTDSLTASSGEAVAVAFRQREGARSFGEATWGVSTGNAAFPLNDGSVIFLTVATMADRTGTVYGGALVPDDEVAGSKTGDPATDDVLSAALQWLDAQPCL